MAKILVVDDAAFMRLPDIRSLKPRTGASPWRPIYGSVRTAS